MAETSKETTPKRSGAHEERERHGKYGDRDPENVTPPNPPVGLQPTPPPRGCDGDDDCDDK